MGNRTIFYSTKVSGFANIIGTIILIIGVICTIISIVLAFNKYDSIHSDNDYSIFVVYAIISFVASAFVSALCFSIANICNNLNIITSIRKHELFEKGITIKQEK